jgi:hypothetical protein
MRHALHRPEPEAANEALGEETDPFDGGLNRAGKAADAMPTREQIRAHTLANATMLDAHRAHLLADREAAVVVMRDGEIKHVFDDWDLAFDWAEHNFDDAHFSVHEISRNPPHVPLAVRRS